MQLEPEVIIPNRNDLSQHMLIFFKNSLDANRVLLRNSIFLGDVGEYLMILGDFSMILFGDLWCFVYPAAAFVTGSWWNSHLTARLKASLDMVSTAIPWLQPRQSIEIRWVNPRPPKQRSTAKAPAKMDALEY